MVLASLNIKERLDVIKQEHERYFGAPGRLIDDIGLVVEEVTGLSIRTTPEFIGHINKVKREIRSVEGKEYVSKFIEKFYDGIETLLVRERW